MQKLHNTLLDVIHRSAVTAFSKVSPLMCLRRSQNLVSSHYESNIPNAGGKVTGITNAGGKVTEITQDLKKAYRCFN